MLKIVIIGAGSKVFTNNLINDITYFDALKNAHIVLMDIDAEKLDLTNRIMQNFKQQHNLSCSFSATTDLREALKDADFAISAIQVGGIESFKFDTEIPLKYGINQCVGDTMNPGGLFRGLRHVAAFNEILSVMEEVCPNVIFMNYSNPMAICTWAMKKAHPNIRSVGLCHGVQGTSWKLCNWLGIDVSETDIITAGINHMAWFIKFEHKGKDMYPEMWKKLEAEGPAKNEEFRFEMFKATGYFMTETSGHLSEYLPYIRHRQDLLELFADNDHSQPFWDTGWYYQLMQKQYKENDTINKKYASGEEKVPRKSPSLEYASRIINAVVTNVPFRFAGNVLNKGLITNLPYDCCVEVPVFADRSGFHSTHIGKLPDQCAGLCESNIRFQTLAVKAALEGDFEAAYHAALLDPLTSAVLAPHEIRNMIDEMFEAEMKWLPQFQGKTNNTPGHTIARLPNKATHKDIYP
jgi:alpha-galactosidase